jgi:glycosyltransferase involved in cell wall biosynthesis
MSARLPVVATNVSGNPEVVVDGVTGYLVPMKDDKMLAERIMTLLGDRNLACEMGKAGRKRVEELFSREKGVEEYETLYVNICKTAKLGAHKTLNRS